MSQAQIHAALDYLKAGDFQFGAEVEEAHRICQMHEGEELFDWVHALVHRIEGDDGNADYWYRRAGRARLAGSVEDEVQTIRETLEGI